MMAIYMCELMKRITDRSDIKKPVSNSGKIHQSFRKC